ncbi:helix-turn-helix domain-containing protein [Streptomyces sp. NPDC002138]|uniref:helix-turn-helix domain-containing protein n=1 Tax=Streptomyces sp. NPDC002138 TaxID=3154410 RepID=UPI003324EF64
MTDQLGGVLRRLRARAGMTQEQVAERSGVSVSTIRRLENGRARDHRLGTLNLLADALEAGAEDRRLMAASLKGARTAPAAEPQPEPQPQPERPAEPPSPPAPHASPPPARGALADAAEELAREVRRRWQREEENRRVHDPYPLPVRWQRTPARLTDGSENIERVQPGESPDGLDLSGDLRSVAEVYRRIPSGRLVVLGRAGSGKSILTIRFVLDFLRAPAPADRVPVVFSLGSWDPTAVALRDWLVERLLRDHPYLNRRVPSGSTLAAALVDADLVLPVLDGFDEIAEGLRPEALLALNAVSLPLVLTSRRDEFAEAVAAAGSPLVWAAGIELTDLTLDDLAAYLPRTARGAGTGAGSAPESAPAPVWEAVLEELRDGGTEASANLAGVLTTPLMVILARTMYSESPGRDPAELLDSARFPTGGAVEDHLLAGFVPTVYRRRVPERVPGGYRRRERNRSPEHAERWLGYLAHHLVHLDRDRQDLAWWQIGDSVRLAVRVLCVVVVTALCVTASEWLIGLLVSPMALPLILLRGALMGLVAGLAFGCVYGGMAALGVGIFEPSHVRLRLPGGRRGTGSATAAGAAPRLGTGRGPVRTSSARFATVLLGAFVMGVGCACALTLERALLDGIPLTHPEVIEGTFINMLAFGLIFGAGAGLVFGFLAVFEVPLDIASAATPVGLLASNRATVTRQVLALAPLLSIAIALCGSLIVGLLQGIVGPLNWSVLDGFFIGAVAGLGGAPAYALSFTAWGQWMVLSRFWLPLTGQLPWDMVAFLDDAYHRGVLRQTGAVYQFRHLRLQHHLGHAFRQRQTRSSSRWADLR